MITHKDRVVGILDGDIIAVRAAAVNDGGDPDDIAGTIHHLVREWTEMAHADTCKVFITEGRCFRYDAYPDYKANRKNKPKPAGTDWAREYILDHWDQEVSNPKYEADDRMGLYATEETDEVRIIVSTDKDMRQIPAWQMSPDHHRFPWKPDKVFINAWRAEQILTGDTVDGYPGLKLSPQVKRFGPAMFQKAVDAYIDWDEANHLDYRWSGWEEFCKEAYWDKDLTTEDYLSQLHCATILHHQLEPEYIHSIQDLYNC